MYISVRCIQLNIKFEIIKQVKELISKNKIQESIYHLKKHYDKNEIITKKIISIESNYQNYIDQKINGTASTQELEVIRNKIVVNIILLTESTNTNSKINSFSLSRFVSTFIYSSGICSFLYLFIIREQRDFLWIHIFSAFAIIFIIKITTDIYKNYINKFTKIKFFILLITSFIALNFTATLWLYYTHSPFNFFDKNLKIVLLKSGIYNTCSDDFIYLDKYLNKNIEKVTSSKDNSITVKAGFQNKTPVSKYEAEKMIDLSYANIGIWASITQNCSTDQKVLELNYACPALKGNRYENYSNKIIFSNLDTLENTIFQDISINLKFISIVHLVHKKKHTEALDQFTKIKNECDSLILRKKIELAMLQIKELPTFSSPEELLTEATMYLEYTLSRELFLIFRKMEDCGIPFLDSDRKLDKIAIQYLNELRINSE